MENNILKKAANLIKDSTLLLRPLKKKEKWDIKRLQEYLSKEDLKFVLKSIKQNKARIELSKLNFSFLISGKDILPVLVSEDERFQEINEKIEEKFYEKLFEEFSSRAYDVLFHYVASDIIGLANLKKAVILQLFSDFPLHILIIGETGSGKEEILNSIRRLAPKASYGLGSGVSSAGLSLSLRGKKVILGLLPKANEGICCISELNLIKKKDISQLYSAMENGFVKYNNIKREAYVRILATAEPKNGDFKSYSLTQIKKQIPFNSSFLSKFHLIFIEKKPNPNEFKVIAEQIITESVKKKISVDEYNFIKKYINYCSNVHVKIPKQLSEQIKSFVLGLKDMEKRLPYSITPNLIKGIVSLIKASARSELRTEVQTKDLERVFSIIRDNMQI